MGTRKTFSHDKQTRESRTMNTRDERTTATIPTITPTEVYSIASRIPKIKRADAFDLVKRMVDGEPLYDFHVAQLYSFFLPPIPAKCKTEGQWVARAVAKKDDPRKHLHYLYSDGSRLVATNGHRLHVWATDRYPAGYYDAALSPVNNQGEYPDIDRVIPSPFARSKDEIRVKLSDLKAVKVGDNLGGIAYKIPGMDAKYGLIASYVRDALNRGGELAILGGNDERTSVLIDGPFDGCQAVVMCMRLR